MKKTPKKLDRVVDQVLAYQPKRKRQPNQKQKRSKESSI